MTIRGLFSKIYQKIKGNTIANKGSINSEILYGLEQNYNKSQQDKKATLEKLRLLRAKTKGKIYLTSKEIIKAKSEGRA